MPKVHPHKPADLDVASLDHAQGRHCVDADDLRHGVEGDLAALANSPSRKPPIS